MGESDVNGLIPELIQDLDKKGKISIDNGAYVSSYGPTSNANADLAWEKTTHTNIGLDFATANSKLFGAIEWFTRTTKDQLLNVTVPVPPNLVSTTLLNIGELTNSGVCLLYTSPSPRD